MKNRLISFITRIFKFILILTIFLNSNTECIKNKKSALRQEGGQNAPKVPIINVHMEEPDRDPMEVKRIEQERRIERNRIRDMELMEEQDKRMFQQIISVQNNQIEKLSKLEDHSSEILEELMAKKG